MHYFLKKIGIVQKLNKILSNTFENQIDVRDFRQKIPDDIFIMKPPFVFEIDLSNYQIDSNPYWKKILRQTSSTLYYTEVYGASIVGRGIVVNNQNKVLLESTIFQKEYLNKLNSNHLVVFKKYIPQRQIDKAFSVSNRLDNNYYHWTMESLSRVLLMYEVVRSGNFKILLTYGAPKFVKESLFFLFNIEPQQIIEKKLTECISVNKLLLVSFPHIRNEITEMTNVYYPEIIKNINRWAHLRIKEKKLNNVEKKYPKNIFISRKNAAQRRIVNEDFFIESLYKYQFVTLYLEDLSFTEQVLHFYYAEKVLAVHGAGITNVIYGNNLSLVELFPKERLIRDAFYFTQITAALQFKHSVIEYSSCNADQDFIVDDKIINKITDALLVS